LKIDIHRL